MSQWHGQPFQLSSDLPREGRNRQDYYREIFGPERAATIMDRLKQTGEEEGISFGSHADAMAPNTLSAHVLMVWAGADDRIDANDLAEKLFFAHHVACEDIGDHTVLTRIAAEVGMDADDVAARLAACEDETNVKERIANSAARGVFRRAVLYHQWPVRYFRGATDKYSVSRRSTRLKKRGQTPKGV